MHEWRRQDHKHLSGSLRAVHISTVTGSLVTGNLGRIASTPHALGILFGSHKQQCP